MSALVALEGAALGLGAEPTLRGVDLALGPGDVVLATGRSGGGKTTLLRAIAGLLAPSAGARRASGASVAWIPQADRLDALHPVTATEVVAAGLGGRPGVRRLGGGLTRGEAAEVRAALDAVGLGGEAGAQFRDLSGGQRQRVLVARSLVVGADILVADEPTSALDDRVAALAVGALAAEAERGAAVLIATHDLQRVAAAGWPAPPRILSVEDGGARWT